MVRGGPGVAFGVSGRERTGGVSAGVAVAGHGDGESGMVQGLRVGDQPGTTRGRDHRMVPAAVRHARQWVLCLARGHPAYPVLLRARERIPPPATSPSVLTKHPTPPLHTPFHSPFLHLSTLPTTLTTDLVVDLGLVLDFQPPLSYDTDICPSLVMALFSFNSI